MKKRPPRELSAEHARAGVQWPEQLQRLLDEGPITEDILNAEAEHCDQRTARFRIAWRAERTHDPDLTSE